MLKAGNLAVVFIELLSWFEPFNLCCTPLSNSERISQYLIWQALGHPVLLKQRALTK